VVVQVPSATIEIAFLAVDSAYSFLQLKAKGDTPVLLSDSYSTKRLSGIASPMAL
jgi:hypothetical protein